MADLDRLRDGEKLRPRSHQKHFYPEPRVADRSSVLREKKLASAMIDISDGLSTDLSHVCEESGVGAVINAKALPVARGVAADHALEFALHGGDEYELLFTARADRKVPAKIAGVPITRIGEIVRGRQMKLKRSDGTTEALRAMGWEHFG